MYVDAIYIPNESIVKVIERVNGKRVHKEYPAIYEYYIKDPKGRFKSIYGEPLSRVTCRSDKEFKISKRINSNKTLYESDIKPVNKIIEEYYQHQNPPDLHIAFFDIETGFDPDTGYSSPEDASNPIISVAVYLQWLDQVVCLALPPKDIDANEAKKIAEEVGNTILFDSEREMLDSFLMLIEDADVLSGWNSEGFDIPYTVNRAAQLLGKAETRRMCLWNQLPKRRTFMRGGRESETFDLSGRIHLDYLQLYKKFSYEERHSYSLDAISEAELGDKKVPYDGTLDELYRKDFKKFLEYNIQDTMLLDRMDKKLQYIDLASSIAHNNCVLIPASMGAVAVTEQAIICEAHARDQRVPDRPKRDNQSEDFEPDELSGLEDQAAGGWVQHPKKGLHYWIGASDLNSLYPSVIRACNMSPETLVGQVRIDKTDQEIYDHVSQVGTKYSLSSWWNDRFNVLEMDAIYDRDNSEKLTLDLATGDSIVVTGEEVRRLVFESGNPWCITANGTIFRTDVQGIVPGLLERWYAERKKMQAIKRDYDALSNGVKIDIRRDYLKEIAETVRTATYDGPKANAYDPAQVFSISHLERKAEHKNSEELLRYLQLHDLVLEEDKVVHRDPAVLKKVVGFWDKRQLVRKINLNSVYGGLLNTHCRFYDKRIGQSTTLTGRSITRHMAAKTNEFIDNMYDHTGRAVIYGDTDSVGRESTVRTLYSNTEEAMSIEELFEKGTIEWTEGGKEYSANSEIMIAHYNQTAKKVEYVPYNYVYRHSVRKPRYRVRCANGTHVDVTEDHSLMVLENGTLVSKTPTQLQIGDQVITISNKYQLSK